jgi:hypothetical protein
LQENVLHIESYISHFVRLQKRIALLESSTSSWLKWWYGESETLFAFFLSRSLSSWKHSHCLVTCTLDVV